MYRLGMPVPPAFIITAQCSVDYQVKAIEFNEEIKSAIYKLESKTNKKFGGVRGIQRPLLLSVRASPSVNVSGLMSTVLNLGMNESVVNALSTLTNNQHWAQCTYVKFLELFGTAVLDVPVQSYQDVLDMIHQRRGLPRDAVLGSEDLKEVILRFKMLAEVPEDPWQQLQMAIEAVFRSWYSPRAVKYRDINGIAGDLGTAVTVQSMVYGNMNTKSGSGVAFTRNPATGQKELYGEFLFNAEVREGLGSARGEVVRRKL